MPTAAWRNGCVTATGKSAGDGTHLAAQQTKHIQSRWLEVLAPVTRIDYVFHLCDWDVVEARVLKMDTGSDHRPVVATLRWTNE